MQEQYGCFKQGRITWTLETTMLPLEDRRINQCPQSSLLETPHIITYTELWYGFRKGLLPNDGGVLDQPRKGMSALFFLEKAIKEKQSIDMKKKQKGK